jgi:nicotinate-nucleotide--dimethylbenzimidazole phosphoribosyltransferase
MRWLDDAVAVPCAASRKRALERQSELTKPPGSLGQLERLAVQLAGLQATHLPSLERIRIAVFAADHGVAVEGVSAFPQAVTRQMVQNFCDGGAAINVLARQVGADLEVIDAGIVQPLAKRSGLVLARAGDGTANFVEQEAMTGAQLAIALAAGRCAADRAAVAGSQLFIGGEMGIANTTAASTLTCALLGIDAEAAVGPGTGLNPCGVSHNCAVVGRALQRHRSAIDMPLAALRCLGGFEIAALAGAYLRCAQRGLPVMVDGFITTVAALLAVRLQPGAADWFLYAHRSCEPGHGCLLDALNAEPLLNFSLRLGEGTGAALAVPALRAACALQRDMATFSQACIEQQRQ